MVKKVLVRDIIEEVEFGLTSDASNFQCILEKDGNSQPIHYNIPWNNLCWVRAGVVLSQ
jgi:hypothetical protein